MKFIVDAQLPKSLSVFLNSSGHNCIHTFDLITGNKTSDNEIIKIASDEDRILITKDGDFLDTFLLSGQPSKLVLIKTGNISNLELLAIFNQHLEKMIKILEENFLVELNMTDIVVHM